MGWTFPDNQININARITFGAVWNDVDLSADVPSGTKLVILHIRNTGGSSYKAITRPNGSTFDQSGTSKTLYTTWHGYYLAILDANRVFEGFFENAALDVAIVAYTINGNYFDPPYDKSFTADDTNYYDINCSSEIPAGIQAGFFEFAPSPENKSALRPNGATYDYYYAHHAPFSMAIMGLDSGRLLEGKQNTAATKGLMLWGYSTDIIPLTTPVDVTPGSTKTWTDCNASLPAGAVGAIMQMMATGYGSYPDPCAIRKKGSTDNIITNVSVYNNRQMFGLVGLDSNRLFQAYINSAPQKIYVIGYVMEAGSGGGITGTVDADLTPLTSAGSGAVTINGGLARDVSPVSAELAGAVKIAGVGAAQLAALTAAETGNILVAALMEALLAGIAAYLTGDVKAAGQVAANLNQLNALLGGNVAVSGQLAALAGQVVSAIQGYVESEAIFGSLLAVLQPPVAALGGDLGVSGLVAANLPPVEGLLSGNLLIGGAVVANSSFATALLAGAVAIAGDCLATLPVLQGLLSQTSMRRAVLMKVLLHPADHRIILPRKDSLATKLEAVDIGVELSDE